MEILQEWGLEILFALVSGAIIGYFKFQGNKLKKKLSDYETLVQEKATQNQKEAIESKLEPIYEELEELRTYIRQTETIEKTHMTLIIASYRFRLVQLCKQLLKQEYMTYSQYEQLTEFYKLYVGLGGNGQAKEFYDKVIKLPVHEEEQK